MDNYSDYLSFMLFLAIVWHIAGSLAVGYTASQRRGSGGAWIVMGLVFGPILAAILLLAYPAIERVAQSTGDLRISS
jgi:hypothetical protein